MQEKAFENQTPVLHKKIISYAKICKCSSSKKKKEENF